MLWARHLLSPEDLRKRAENFRKFGRESAERQYKKGHPKQAQEGSALSLQRACGQQTDCSSLSRRIAVSGRIFFRLALYWAAFIAISAVRRNKFRD
jgi:hypothetical protein